MPIGTYVQAWNFVIMVLLAPEAFSFACLDFAELQNAWLPVGQSGGDDVAFSTPPILRKMRGRSPCARHVVSG